MTTRSTLALIALTTLTLIACTRSEPAAQPNAESAACCANEQAPVSALGAPHAHDTNTRTGTSTGAPSDSAAVIASVRAVAEVTRDGVVLRVQNHGEANVTVSSRVRVVQVIGEESQVVPNAVIALGWSCDAPVEDCVALAPGAELIPPAWPARAGKAACGPCPECTEPPAGNYRFVLNPCGHTTEIHSNTFVLTADRSPSALAADR